jgi:hypothetical protein
MAAAAAAEATAEDAGGEETMVETEDGVEDASGSRNGLQIQSFETL